MGLINGLLENLHLNKYILYRKDVGYMDIGYWLDNINITHPVITDGCNRKQTSWVILYNKNKLVLGKRSLTSKNPNLWGFFGGTVDVDIFETPIEAAARELREEIGFHTLPTNLKFLCIINNAYYYTLECVDNILFESSNEISKIRMFELINIPQQIHHKTKEFFDYFN